jgi:hypothetical protein
MNRLSSLDVTHNLDLGNVQHQYSISVHQATSDNLRTHDSILETLMPEGNKSRVSGDRVEPNYPENAA